MNEVCFDCGLAPAGGDGFCDQCRKDRYWEENDLPSFTEGEWDDEPDDEGDGYQYFELEEVEECPVCDGTEASCPFKHETP